MLSTVGECRYSSSHSRLRHETGESDQLYAAGGRVGPRVRLEVLGNIQISCPNRETNPGSSSPQAYSV
jgi:hypothetical protein